MTKIKMSRDEILTRYAAGGRNFPNVNLSGADLSGAYLTNANLSGANLRGAILSGTNLSGVDLSNANLSKTVGNGRQIKSLQCGVYAVAYTAERLTIGCEAHPIQDWWSFDEATISEMDPLRSLEWWRVWKPILQQIIAASPATPTGHERKEEEVK